MSYKVFFSMSSGLSKPITVPKGTYKNITERVHKTEQALGYRVEQFGNNPKYWSDTTKPMDGVSDDTFCEVAEEHNLFVRCLYVDMTRWFETPPLDGEIITVEQATEFWYGLSIIHVPVSRWTPDYYRGRMEAIYMALRGFGEAQPILAEGMVFDSKPLTIRQAADVIILFSNYLDEGDLRLDVPLGCDSLKSSDDGGYYWCEKCGAVTPEHAERCRKRKCPVKAEWDNEES
jgi:hypothetical protein